MADGVNSICASSHLLPLSKGNINEFDCEKCSVYQSQLKEVLDELGSARLIIDILKKDLLTSTTAKITQENGLAPTDDFVNANLRRKKTKSFEWKNINTLKLLQPQPIPVIMNKYAPLDSLQEEPEASRNHNRISEITSLRDKKKYLPQTKKRKVIIIGDSHARGYAAEISSTLGKDFEVTGTVIPGARLENITKLADSEISSLGKRDSVIVIGGANDINKNEVNVGLKHLGNFVKNRQNTNIMIVTAPHRYDPKESSCVNKEIEVFNRKLHKVLKTVDNVKIIQANLSRNDFTRHGLHLNLPGKEKIAKQLGESINNLTSRKENAPVTLKWEETKKEPTQKETKEKITTDVIKEPNLQETRSSKRQKRIPATMNDDFLWTQV
jgi:hypothetical protein